MRSGELLALTPSDFDFEKQTVTISKTFHRSKGRDIITSPKTDVYKRQGLKREKTSGYRKSEQLEEQIKALHRDLTDEKEKRIHGENARDAARKELDSMEQELSLIHI